MENSKDFVTIRQRLRASGLVALFLRYYYKGKRREESLRLYLVPEKTREDKRKNKDTMAIAEQIRAERLVELKKNIFRIEDRQQTPLLEFIDALISDKKESRANAYRIVKRYLLTWGKAPKYLDDLTSEDVAKFVAFIRGASHFITGRPLRPNTIHVYINSLKSVLNLARKKGIISETVCAAVMAEKREDTERVFLTADELKRMIATPSASPAVKSAFLFSCFTGLRWSDVTALEWSQVSLVEGMHRITFRQKKTGGLLYMDISETAFGYMGEIGAGKVFPSLVWPGVVNKQLTAWAHEAGVEKHVTFHSARHTFATLSLLAGVDLYTVSRLLGHTDVKTTQVYAKVVDEKRREAVNLLDSLIK